MSTPVAPESGEHPGEGGKSSTRASRDGLRVLLVEDNEGERWLFSELLRSRGHTVVACPDAESAWEAYREEPASLALLDWILPGMDGLDLCRRIRASDRGEETVVVVVTARDEPEALQEVLEAGADDYIAKPVDVGLMNVRLAVAEKAAEVRRDRIRSQTALEARSRQIEELFRNLGQVFFSVDVDENRLIQVSEGAEKVLGIDAERLRDDPDLWGEHLQAVDLADLEPGQPHTFRHSVPRPDGEARWIETRLVRSGGPEGRSGRVDGIVVDVTEQHRAEEGLAERNEELMTLYRLSEITLTARSSREAYDEILEVVSQATGFPVAMVETVDLETERTSVVAARGLPADRTRKLVDVPLHEALSESVVRTGEPAVEADVRRRVGNAHPALGKVGLRAYLSFPLVVGGTVSGTLTLGDFDRREPDRRLIRWAGSLANWVAAYMERIESQEALRESERRYRELNRDLRAASAELEAFAYSISHDLRTPLRTMTGFAHALLESLGEGVPPKALDYARRIIASGERSEELIRDLLAYSRLTSEEITPERVSLEVVVRTAKEQVHVQMEERDARVEISDDLPDVLGHEATLLQVLTNLLSNAVKFVPDDRTPRIRIRGEVRDDRVRLEVEDNGRGIPADQHSRIFRVFERLAESRDVPGTGIGLAVVRRGMERMRGAVGVESEPGEGSTFWLELPRPESGSGRDAGRSGDRPRPGAPGVRAL